MKEELKKNLEQLLEVNNYKGKVTKLQYLTGGASNETWKFSLLSLIHI